MKKVNLLVALAAAGSFAGVIARAGAEAAAAFEPVRADHSGRLYVEALPERAIHLFTGPGERLWVDGWNPVVLSGDGTEAGTVFVTDHCGHTTIWIVVDFDDTQAFRARYARTTPNISAGTVEVNLEPDGDGGSQVHVSYALTALSEVGNQQLAGFDAAAFAEMMKDWELHIRAAEVEIEAPAGHQIGSS
ncbi:MAG: SRPBCC family protein [Thermoanaerobaculia bacterium]